MLEVENECLPHVRSEEKLYELLQLGADMFEFGEHGLQSI